MRLRYRLMLPALLVAAAAFGQSAHLHLDNYTIPAAKKGALVGKLHDQKSGLDHPQIVEDTSGLFRLSKKGELRLKKRKTVPAAGPSFQYTITVQNGDSRESFTLVRDNFHRNKVVAHRGAFKNNAGSENSITALKDAIRLGCEGSEFDVWLSSDGVPVLSHDPHIGGKTVEETTLAELQTVQLKNGDRVPTFEEYIEEAMKQNGTHMVLELKPSRTGRGMELTQACYDLIRKYRCQAWMLYISFDYEICKKLVALDPFAKVAYLNGDKTPAELKADKIWGLDYSMKAIDKDISILQEAKKAGITTNIWTVNDPAKMDAYLEAGVDFITTNEPEILLEKVK